MSCKNYILRLLKSHGWDTLSTTTPPVENITLPKDAIPPDPSPTTAAAASVNKLQVLQHHGVPIFYLKIQILMKIRATVVSIQKHQIHLHWTSCTHRNLPVHYRWIALIKCIWKKVL